LCERGDGAQCVIADHGFLPYSRRRARRARRRFETGCWKPTESLARTPLGREALGIRVRHPVSRNRLQGFQAPARISAGGVTLTRKAHPAQIGQSRVSALHPSPGPSARWQ
jgi:hypothetical protein